jgi:hypothetical protein
MYLSGCFQRFEGLLCLRLQGQVVQTALPEHYDILKGRETLTTRHCVTSHNTRIFSNTAVKASVSHGSSAAFHDDIEVRKSLSN